MLEARIEALNEGIRVLIFKPQSNDAAQLRVMYYVLRDMENAELYGTREWKNQTGEEKPVKKEPPWVAPWFRIPPWFHRKYEKK